jgi:hypothetical protein
LFPDGTALTNPSANQVRARLAAVESQPSEVNQN